MLLDCIKDEKRGKDYCYPKEDKPILKKMLREINKFAGTNYHYLAEIDEFNIPGSGEIMAKYITMFSSEDVRAYLVPQMVFDKVKDCDKLVLQLYLHFKASDEYIAKPGCPSPAHIYVRYDNAIRKLKPKRLKKELLELAHNPRDAYYLPFTMRMLASWKIQEMKDLLLSYLSPDSITPQDVGIDNIEKPYYPSFESIKRDLIFTAIEGLKYYSSEETVNIIKVFADDPDQDIKMAAQKSLKFLMK